VHRALAGDQVADALERVAATGALETARALAEDYAARARAALDGEPDRGSLEALTHAVVNREN
jgi:geranylgeranyl pyrophosphate synthase